MDKMSIRVIMKSGVEFTIKCEKFTTKQDVFGKIIGKTDSYNNNQ